MFVKVRHLLRRQGLKVQGQALFRDFELKFQIFLSIMEGAGGRADFLTVIEGEGGGGGKSSLQL